MNHTKVFISYSHADKKYLTELKTHLKPLEQRGLIELWDDTGIKPGLKWPQEIEAALATAKVAILMVSASFLASKFINSKELPELLAAAKARGTQILPIIVTACGVERTEELQEFQAFNSPDKPLNKMLKGNRDILLKKVADRVNELVNSIELENPIPRPTPVVPTPANKEKPAPPKEVHSPSEDREKDNANPIGRRWRHFILPGLIGLAVGLICSVLITRYALRPPTPQIVNVASNTIPCPQVKTYSSDEFVLIIGSGTVYSYLKAAVPCAFNNLSNNEHINIQLLQGPTGTGAKLFAHIFEQVPTLVMASKRLSLNDLSRTVPSQSEAKPLGKAERKPQAAFEVYLGADTLQILLVAGSKNAKDKTLRADFPDIISNRSGEKMDELEFASLVKIEKWLKGEYNVYVGSEGGATRDLWEKRLTEPHKPEALHRFKAWWPAKLHFWDVQDSGAIHQSSNDPNIYLGSKLLFDVEIERNINNSHLILTMVDKSKQPVRRGLYLYGFVDIRERKNHGKEPGYDLPKYITEILKYLFDSLKGSKLNLLDAGCLKNQRDYFHLDSDVGWVKEHAITENNIYRAEPCTRHPEE